MTHLSKNSVRRYIQWLTAGAVSVTTLAPGMTLAQEEPAKEQAGDRVLEEVVVTGTQMRGVDPVGAEVIAMDVDDIAATGATTTAELMATVPQLNTFGTVPAVRGGDNVQLSVNRINIRNLPQGTGAASPTLLLMNGHRLVGAGVQQNYPDPDVVPPAVLQRVDILTDGGSAIYGADAIGGVVNFITRKDIDGVEVSLNQGFGDNYYSTDTSLTLGRDWGETSAFVSYNYQQNDQILGKNRGYVKSIDWETGIPVDRSCTPANVSIGSDNWAVNPEARTLSPGLANACDRSRTSSIFPEGERNSVFAGFNHTLTDTLHFDLHAWYTKRENTSDEGPLAGTAAVSSSSPVYISTGGDTATANQSVGFDFAPITGMHNGQETNLETYGIVPTLTWDIGWDWQMRAFYNYGYSETDYRQNQVDDAAVTALAADGSLDPYNIVNSTDEAIATAFDREQRGRSEQEMHDFKAVFDGPLFELPGGELRLAFGAEYIDEDYKGAFDEAERGFAYEYNDADRDVTAYFGELNIPVVGFGNQLPGIYELTFAIAWRYDDYSDFGDTDSPNYAVTYMPLEWLTLRGVYNEGFQAPGLADLATSQATSSVFNYNVVQFLENPAVPSTEGQVLTVAQGTVLPLDPQTSEAWNIGFEINVPFVEGLDIGASAYRIEYTGQISIPPVQDPAVFYSQFPNNYIMLPSNAEATEFLLGAGVDPDDVVQTIAEVGPRDMYASIDARSANLGYNQYEGYDFFMNYARETSFGMVWANFNGTYLEDAFDQVDPSAEKVQKAGVDSSRFNYVLSLGAYIGENISTRAAINYVDGYDLSNEAQLGQDDIDDWYTVNLYAQYDFPAVDGWAENLSVSLGATNVFDEDPPEYYATDPGGNAGYRGSTLGRVVSLGFKKVF